MFILQLPRSSINTWSTFYKKKIPARGIFPAYLEWEASISTLHPRDKYLSRGEINIDKASLSPNPSRNLPLYALSRSICASVYRLASCIDGQRLLRHQVYSECDIKKLCMCKSFRYISSSAIWPIYLFIKLLSRSLHSFTVQKIILLFRKVLFEILRALCMREPNKEHVALENVYFLNESCTNKAKEEAHSVPSDASSA